MGYRIEYSKDIKQGSPRRSWALPALIGIIALLAVLEFAGIKEQITAFFLPGDPAVTAAAFDGFLENVRAGESAGDAITAFCREIIASAR